MRVGLLITAAAVALALGCAGSARVHLRCTYCGGTDHNYEACPKIRSHPAPGGVVIRDRGYVR